MHVVEVATIVKGGGESSVGKIGREREREIPSSFASFPEQQVSCPVCLSFKFVESKKCGSISQTTCAKLFLIPAAVISLLDSNSKLIYAALQSRVQLINLRDHIRLNVRVIA